MPRKVVQLRTIEVRGEVAFVPLTQGYVAEIDADDVALVSKFNWRTFWTLRYRHGASFPYSIAVAGIEAFPPDAEVPTWEDLRGRAPDATGALSSEAFIRELRDAWG